MSSLITALCALTSKVDPKVRLIHQKPNAGSNQWAQVVFNDYCYERNGDSDKTELRTRAMADIFGQAACLLAKEDPMGNMSLRTFYRNKEGNNTPRLHIAIRPQAAQATEAQMDVHAELAKLTERLAELEYDFSAVPKAISDSPGAYVGWMRSALAKLSSKAAIAEASSGNVDTGETEDAPF
jgi:hypothetical protein